MKNINKIAKEIQHNSASQILFNLEFMIVVFSISYTAYLNLAVKCVAHVWWAAVLCWAASADQISINMRWPQLRTVSDSEELRIEIGTNPKHVARLIQCTTCVWMSSSHKNHKIELEHTFWEHLHHRPPPPTAGTTLNATKRVSFSYCPRVFSFLLRHFDWTVVCFVLRVQRNRNNELSADLYFLITLKPNYTKWCNPIRLFVFEH